RTYNRRDRCCVDLGRRKPHDELAEQADALSTRVREHGIDRVFERLRIRDEAACSFERELLDGARAMLRALCVVARKAPFVDREDTTTREQRVRAHRFPPGTHAARRNDLLERIAELDADGMERVCMQYCERVGNAAEHELTVGRVLECD